LSWASSAAFIDGAKINLPSGKKNWPYQLIRLKAPVMSLGRSTEFTKASIENYSKRWFEYSYPVATNVAGNEGGMGIQGLYFVDGNLRRFMGCNGSWFGHNWFL
jgi:hypothetical protein